MKRPLVPALFVASLLAAGPLRADEPEAAPSLFPHSPDSPFWISGQVNLIYQWHGDFHAAYSGENSLRPVHEDALSRLLTLYAGLRTTRWTEVVVDVESAGGSGISDALGLAGFTNADVVRNPTLGAKPYLARLTGRFVVPLSDSVEAARGPLSVFDRLPARRVEIRAGKFGLVDIFDVNSVGSDSHQQFTNWAIVDNGAYDFAADTRGYTVGVTVAYQDQTWAARYALALMPKVANGVDLEWDVGRARSHNLELELRRGLVPGRTGVLRLLAYRNVANMGSYREAIAAFEAGQGSRPDIEAHRQQGRVKYGFGANVEEEVGGGVRLFGRTGWNEGANESFAYTEVNSTVSVGGDVRGRSWHREADKLGVAFASNGLSNDHREYLALGGLGFLLGDGALRYGRETIVEAYYTASIWRGLSAAVGFSRIWNPGYNRDRGPVFVPMLRFHADL